MRMTRFAVALLVGAAAPAVAQETTTAQAGTAKPDKVKQICRTLANTGSRMPKRQCKTQAEWEQKGNATLLDTSNNQAYFSSRADLPR